MCVFKIMFKIILQSRRTVIIISILQVKTARFKEIYQHVHEKITKSLEKTLMLEKTEGKMRRGWQRLRWLDSIIASMDMNLSKLWQIVKDRRD